MNNLTLNVGQSLDFFNARCKRAVLPKILGDLVTLTAAFPQGVMLGDKTKHSLVGLGKDDHPVLMVFQDPVRVFIQPHEAVLLVEKLNKEHNLQLHGRKDYLIKEWTPLLSAVKQVPLGMVINAMRSAGITEVRVLAAGMDDAASPILDELVDGAPHTLDLTSTFLVD